MPSLKISIRRKPIVGEFTDAYLEVFPIPAKRVKVPNSYGILTASSEKLFIGLQLLLSSICHSYDVRVLVVDTGMTERQVEWCLRQPGVMVKKYNYKGEVGDHIKYIGAWLKPFYMDISPFKHTIWIDSDAMVQGNLMELVDLCHPKAFFTSDWSTHPPWTLNQPSLYQLLPVPANQIDIPPYLNTGVYILNRKRDAKIIEDWQYCVRQAFQNKPIADSISCWDQGAAKWALHNNDMLYLISPDRKYNYSAKIRHYAYPSFSHLIVPWLKHIRDDNCIVYHWMGSPKPWDKWGEMLNLDLTTKTNRKSYILV